MTSLCYNLLGYAMRADPEIGGYKKKLHDGRKGKKLRRELRLGSRQ